MNALFEGEQTGYKSSHKWTIIYVNNDEIVAIGSADFRQLANADAEQMFLRKCTPAGSVKLIYRHGVVVSAQAI